MNTRMRTTTPYVVALMVFGAPVAAGFDRATSCTGQMMFPNPDGSSQTYQLELTLGPDAYRVQSRNVKNGDMTSDAGTCGDYLQTECRHDIEVNGELIDDFYRFELRPLSGTSFAYTETWKDGAIGRTILTCQAQ